MSATRASAQPRSTSTRFGLVDGGTRLSPDGRLLVILLAVTLLGPYLPLFEWLGYPGLAAREVRADNLLLPVLAVYVLVRCLSKGRVYAPLHVVLYGTFCAWLVLVTVVWAGNVPAAYGGNPDAISLLRGGDAYIRPLLLLFIMANVRLARQDITVIVRIMLIVAVLLALVAAAQLTPGTGQYVNPFLASHYDNSGSDQYFWAVLSQGRVAALMPQLSTLGMYMVLVLGILGAQFLGATLVRSRILFSVVIAAALAGGVLCGSKVFAGGLLLVAALAVFWWPMSRRRDMATLTAIIAAGVAAWIIVAGFFPEQADRFKGRIPSSADGFYRQYIAPRFEPDSGKVYRTGAMDIASNYPLSGLGLNVVGNTTDSLLLGVVIMSGAVGAALYVGAIGVVGVHLHVVSRAARDPDTGRLARMMTVLTVVFLITAIGFHTFIQDRAGDAYWMMVGLLLAPIVSSVNETRTKNLIGPARRHPEFSGRDTTSRASDGAIDCPEEAPALEQRLQPPRALDYSGQRRDSRRVRTASHGDSCG